MVIKATSAGFNGGNFAKIEVNNDEVTVEQNENGHNRGLNIVVINPITGQVDLAISFDTHKSSDCFEAFINMNLAIGSIVVAACKDDCTVNLSDKVKNWFG